LKDLQAYNIGPASDDHRLLQQGITAFTVVHILERGLRLLVNMRHNHLACPIRRFGAYQVILT
jgi:hypothetical protein